MNRLAVWFRLAILVALAAPLPACAYFAEPNQLSLANINREVEFRWVSSTFGDRIEPHSAIIVPVRIEGSPKTLYMQLDLGTPSTVLKANMVASLAERLGGFTVVGDGSKRHVGDVAFTLGEVRIRAARVGIRDGSATAGVAWDDPDRIDVIGTIGSDLLDGRVLALDYPRERLFVGDAIPAALVPAGPMFSFSFAERRVILDDVMIDEEPRRIMLDTGSSAFALLTNEAEWSRMSNGGQGATRFSVNSWGSSVTAHVAPTASVARFGDTVIPLGSVAYIEGISGMQTMMMRASGMGCMTGNKLFLDKVLILSAPTLTYAVVEPGR